MLKFQLKLPGHPETRSRHRPRFRQVFCRQKSCFDDRRVAGDAAQRRAALRPDGDALVRLQQGSSHRRLESEKPETRWRRHRAHLEEAEPTEKNCSSLMSPALLYTLCHNQSICNGCALKSIIE
jgi:hypothetical protein